MTEFIVYISYDNSTWIDVSEYIVRDSVSMTYSLHSSSGLEPNSNTATFSILGYKTLLTALTSSTENIYCKILRNGLGYINGVISPNADIELATSGVKPTSLKVEDFTLSKLKRNISTSFNLSNYKVCDPSNTSNSLIHYLLNLAGITLIGTVPTISTIVPYLSVISSDDKTYYTIITQLLYENGYLFYFDRDGKFTFYNLADCPTSYNNITQEFCNDVANSESNILSFKNSTSRGSVDELKITWKSKILKTDLTVFEDSTGATSAYSCVIDVNSGAYYPTKDSESGTIYSDYKNDSWTIDNVVSASLTESDTGLTLVTAFTNYGKKCLFSYKNNTSSIQTIHQLKVVGSAWVEGDTSIIYITIFEDPQNTKEITLDYINTKIDADNFAEILNNYYTYNSISFNIESASFFELGTYVKIYDNVHYNKLGYGRIREIKYNTNGTYNYGIESICEYKTIASPSSVGTLKQNSSVVTKAQLVSNTISISTSDLVATGGSVAGVAMSSTKLYVGNGIFNNANTGFYLDSTGQFSLKNKLSFDGSNLVINGSGSFTGSVTASSGSFTGTIYAGSGTIGGATLASSYIQSTNYVAGTSGWKLDNGTGYLYAENANISGIINSSGGAIGGWYISATKLYSDASGGTIVLDQGNARISVQDSNNADKVVMGYLEGLAKNSGSGTWTSSDYGFWVKPGNSIVIDGSVSTQNGDMINHDASYKIYSGTTEIVRLGTDNAKVGLALYNASGNCYVYNNGGTLTLSGNTSISGKLAVSGNSSFGNTIINGSLKTVNDLSLDNSTSDSPDLVFANSGIELGRIWMSGNNLSFRVASSSSAVTITSSGDIYASTLNGALNGNSTTATTASNLTNFINQSGARYTTDYNTLLQTGFYNGESTPSNAPNSFGQLIVAKGIDTGLQIAGGYSCDNLYFRGWWNGGSGFSSWRTVIHNGNIGSQSVNYATSAGTASTANAVSINGGLTTSSSPTFAGLTIAGYLTKGQGIIESGGNSSGSYVKFANGLMIQWLWQAGNASYGTLTFPTPFNNISYAIAGSAYENGYGDDHLLSVYFSSRTVSNIHFANRYELGSGSNYITSYNDFILIGYWKSSFS